MSVTPRPMTAREAIVSTWRLPAPVQETFLRFPHLLAANPYLTESVWYHLWETIHETQRSAIALVVRPLSAAQIDRVVATEHRFDVLYRLVIENDLAPSQIEDAVANCSRPSGLANAALGIWDYPPSTTRRLASSLEGHNALAWAARRADVMPDNQVVNLVVSDTQLSKRRNEGLLDLIIDARPHLIGRIAECDVIDKVRTIMAASRFATADLQLRILGISNLSQVDTVHDETALMMLMNPRCTQRLAGSFAARHHGDAIAAAATGRLRNGTIDEPYETVDLDSSFEPVYTWLREARPTVSEFRPSWVTEILSLLSNPTITQPQVTELMRLLHTHGRVVSTLISHDKLAQVLESVTSRFSTSGLAASLLLHHPESAPFVPHKRRPDVRDVPRDPVNVDSVNLPTQNVWMAPNAAASLVTDLLGDNTGEWEVFLGLAEHHTGRLSDCVKAAQRLLVYH